MATAKANTAALVDELGALELESYQWRLKAARLDVLRKALREAVPDKNPGLPFTITGKRFIAELGPRALVRTVNTKTLFSLVSQRCFLSLVSCTLKALETADIVPAIRAQVIEEALTGSRSITLTEKAAA